MLAEEIKDSVSQTTGWLVLVASSVATALPEIESSIHPIIDRVFDVVEYLRQTAQELGVMLSMLWIGLPLKVREFITS